MSPGWEEQSEIVLSPPPLTRSPLSSCSLAPVNPTSLPLGQPCVSLLLLPAVLISWSSVAGVLGRPALIRYYTTTPMQNTPPPYTPLYYYPLDLPYTRRKDNGLQGFTTHSLPLSLPLSIFSFILFLLALLLYFICCGAIMWLTLGPQQRGPSPQSRSTCG